MASPFIMLFTLLLFVGLRFAFASLSHELLAMLNVAIVSIDGIQTESKHVDSNPLLPRNSVSFRASILMTSMRRLKRMERRYAIVLMSGITSAGVFFIFGCYAINKATGTNAWTISFVVGIILLSVMSLPLFFRPLDAAYAATNAAEASALPEPLTESDSNLQMLAFARSKLSPTRTMPLDALRAHNRLSLHRTATAHGWTRHFFAGITRFK
jgi:hypothetical protein